MLITIYNILSGHGINGGVPVIEFETRKRNVREVPGLPIFGKFLFQMPQFDGFKSGISDEIRQERESGLKIPPQDHTGISHHVVCHRHVDRCPQTS
jgi:hypothetical protein